jgi:molybdopterin-guanine dinucleotide biosynthesis protein A
MQLDAIVLAGGDPDQDAELLAYAGGAPRKTLIKLGDKTLLEHVVSALLGARQVRRVAVVGLPDEYHLDLGPAVSFLPDAGSMLGNGEAGVVHYRSTGQISDRVLVSSGDIPLLTSEVVSELIERSASYDVDFCYTIVSQEAMERTFPGSGRTFVPIGGRRFAGGDVCLVKPSVLDANRAKLEEIIGDRKAFWKQVRAVGFDTLLLFLFRQLTIEHLERRVSKALGFTGKVIIYPYAQVAMDVDKPNHLDVIRAAWKSGAAGERRE